MKELREGSSHLCKRATKQTLQSTAFPQAWGGGTVEQVHAKPR